MAGESDADDTPELPQQARGMIEEFVCESCRAMFSDKRTNELMSSPEGLIISRKRSDVEVTDLNGCQLCHKFFIMSPSRRWRVDVRNRELASRTQKGDWIPPPSWRSRVYKHLGFEQTFFPKKWLDDLLDPYVRYQIKWDDKFPSRIHVVQHIQYRRNREAVFMLKAQFDDPAAQYVSARTSNPNVKYDGTYERIRSWLKSCDERHVSCETGQLHSKIWPSLLVDVTKPGSASDHIRLVQTSELSSIPLYATLSYCWGGPQRKATSTENLASYLDRIELRTLPQTLQDSVFVTRKLGLQYIWIDSLCIVQDAELMKTHEVGRMEQIYSNSYITISANCATSCEDGFLHTRKPWSGPTREEIPFTCHDGSVGNVVISPAVNKENNFEFSDYLGRSQPIDLRAWILQEAFMSTRMLLFTERQIFWVCSETWGKDGGAVDRRDYYLWTGEMSRRVLKSPNAEDWVTLIKDYLKKEMTDPHDKLPALSSVAAYFSKTLNDRYVAGLWRNRLNTLLSWQNDCLSRKSLRRSPVWRAPSWSYMSVDGEISFEHHSMVPSHPKHGTTLLVKVLECDAQPLSLDAPFGRLHSAYLRVTGRLIQAQPIRDDIWSSSTRECYGVYPMGTKTASFDSSYGNIEYDTFSEEGSEPSVLTNHGSRYPNDPVWCLLVHYQSNSVHLETLKRSKRQMSRWWGDWEPWWGGWGLVLDKLANGKYHRIGYFTFFSHLSLFYEQPQQTLDIV